MEKYPPGLERPGARVDRLKMEFLFNMLHFDVEWLVDREDLKRELTKISKNICNETSDSSSAPSNKKKKPDCFVCFVSAHGNTDEDGHYITDASKSKVYIIGDILEPFMTCDELKGIPKVFFINACRGNHRSTDRVVDYVQKTGKDSLVVETKDVGAMVTIANNMLRKNSEDRFRREKKKVLCQVAPSHSNLTGKLYWRTQRPPESSAGK
jgi:hypothetical protein